MNDCYQYFMNMFTVGPAMKKMAVEAVSEACR